MLQAMRVSGARVPEVLHQGGVLLCLEWLTETTPNADAWQALGVTLARLHGSDGAAYGWPEDYAFGPVVIDNAARSDWPTFWAEARLACHLPHIPSAFARRIEALAVDLPNRLPRAPRGALLHGDLWTGNALFSGDTAFLIDPACYHGDAEVDLAMLDLFGAPHARFWQGYGPVEPDRASRRAIYQLWPALVHLRLFGAGYEPMVSGLLDVANR